MDPTNDITQTKFYDVVMGVVFSSQNPQKTVDLAPTSNLLPETVVDVPWSNKSDDVTYLEGLLGELESRRAFAVMCVTPDKLTRMSARHLSDFIKDSTELIRNIKKDIKVLKKENYKVLNTNKDNLSQNERRRIDNLINGA